MKICERMHWTFSEYDQQTAEDIAIALEVWRVEKLHEDAQEQGKA